MNSDDKNKEKLEKEKPPEIRPGAVEGWLRTESQRET
jgi:hypothetical protein